MSAAVETELSAVAEAEQAMSERAVPTEEKEEEKKEEKTGAEGGRLICFVCTGNTCRSPMAAAVLNARRGEDRSIRAVSRGLAPVPGAPISDGARHALLDAGIESTEDNPWQQHRAEQIDEEMMRRADLIVGISSTHALALISAFPLYAEKITSMPRDIADPYGGDDETYRSCLAAISDGIGELFP